jgi:hypothetical protein
LTVVWLVVLYLAIATLAGLLYAFGASVGYGKGLEDGRHTAHMALRRTITAMGARALPPTAGRENTGPVAANRRLHTLFGQGPRLATFVAILLLLLAAPAAALMVEPEPAGRTWRAQLALEGVQLRVTPQPAKRADLHAELMARRLADLQLLLARGAAPAAIAAVVDRLEHHAKAGAAETVRATNGRPARAAAAVRQQAALQRHVAVLTVLEVVACQPQAGTPLVPQVCASVHNAADAAAVALTMVEGVIEGQPSPPGQQSPGDGPDVRQQRPGSARPTPPHRPADSRTDQPGPRTDASPPGEGQRPTDPPAPAPTEPGSGQRPTEPPRSQPAPAPASPQDPGHNPGHNPGRNPPRP